MIQQDFVLILVPFNDISHLKKITYHLVTLSIPKVAKSDKKVPIFAQIRNQDSYMGQMHKNWNIFTSSTYFISLKFITNEKKPKMFANLAKNNEKWSSSWSFKAVNVFDYLWKYLSTLNKFLHWLCCQKTIQFKLETHWKVPKIPILVTYNQVILRFWSNYYLIIHHAGSTCQIIISEFTWWSIRAQKCA